MTKQFGHDKTMPLELITIPCLSDNYAFLFGDPDTNEAVLFDVPDPAPINNVVAQSGWTLTTVILSHHHWDHIDGLDGLENRRHTKIIGAKTDAHRLPPLDLAVSDGDTIRLLGEDAHIIDVSGHTLGHVAIHLPTSGYAITMDSLMAFGCGRLFEGTPEQMWESLKKLRALPADTIICSGHEYTESNARFAASLEPDNPRVRSRIKDVETARAAGRATVPSVLSEECATNPFLRADDPVLQAAIGMVGAPAEQVFTEIRGRKDRF